MQLQCNNCAKKGGKIGRKIIKTYEHVIEPLCKQYWKFVMREVHSLVEE